MTSTKIEKKRRPKQKAQAVLSAEEQQALLAREKQIRERRAETQLELAKLFLQKEKPDIARRRLQELVSEFRESAAAGEAQTLLKKLSTQIETIKVSG